MQLYQHYLGALFVLIHDDIEVNEDGKTYVVCCRLVDNDFQIFTFSKFHENVEHEGKTGPRFRFIADPADIMPKGGHP